MAEMAWRWVGDLVVLVHTAHAPADDDWEAYVSTFDAERLLRGTSLVFTEGGAPTTRQRQRIQSMTLERPFPTAVMAPSALVRGVITALSWFNAGIRAFRPDDVASALTYLGIDESRRAEIESVRDELYRTLHAG